MVEACMHFIVSRDFLKLENIFMIVTSSDSMLYWLAYFLVL